MIIYDLPMEQYLAHPAIGSSQLKHMLLTPADYKAALEQRSNETKATVLGTAVHAAILEPDTFDDRYALQPEDWGPRNVGSGKKRWDEFKAENSDKLVVGYEDACYLRRVQEATKNHSGLREYLASGRAEVTGFSRYNELIELKARADLLSQGMLWDVKTTSESIDDENIARIIFASRYHFQVAHHLRVFNDHGLELSGAGWIFISTKTPAIHIRLVQALPDLLTWARRDHDYALEKLDICMQCDSWPGYHEGVQDIVIPEWARRRYENL